MLDINSICKIAGDRIDRVTLPLSLCHNHIGMDSVIRRFNGICGIDKENITIARKIASKRPQGRKKDTRE